LPSQDYRFSEHDAVQSITNLPTPERKLLPRSSRHKSNLHTVGFSVV